MPNSLAATGYGFNDAATLLNSIVSQATGASAVTATNLQEFISIGTTALSMGYDPILQAISQVLSKTIFSIRPYDEKFKGLLADSARWGNHQRKLKISDAEFESDGRWWNDDGDFLEDGDSQDQWSIKKPDILQLNFYGQNPYQDHVTIFADQLDVAFRDPDELMRLTSMIMTNMSNRMAHARETMGRAALTNFIAGKNALGSGHVIHLVDVYNAARGTSLTTSTVRAAANWPDFVRWLGGYIMTLSDMFTEYTSLYQQNVTGHVINGFVPKDRQKLYLLSSDANSMITEVLSTTYNEKLARIGDFEAVNFWQAAQNPDEIKVSPSYLKADGTVVAGDAQTMSNVLGILFDEDAIMDQQINERNIMTPMNGKGAYSNYWLHASHRYMNDFTCKGVVLLLDTAPEDDEDNGEEVVET